MTVHRLLPPALLCGLIIVFLAVGESAEQSGGTTFPDAPGKDILMSRCFQCHGEGMWKDLRQDRRGWDGVLYRMVGRGALWSEEEINTMAAYLTTALGPQARAPK